MRSHLGRERGDVRDAGPSKNGLLHALGAGFCVEECFKNGEDVAAILDHSSEKISQRRIALGLAIPLQLHRGRNLDVSPKLFRGVSTQEKAVKESGLPLREVEVVL